MDIILVFSISLHIEILPSTRRLKLSAYNSVINSLNNTPLSEENFNLELNIMKQIAIKIGYNPESYPINVFKRSNERRSFKTISNFGKSSEKDAALLRKQDNNIAYKANNSLAKHIKKCQEKILLIIIWVSIN